MPISIDRGWMLLVVGAVLAATALAVHAGNAGASASASASANTVHTSHCGYFKTAKFEGERRRYEVWGQNYRRCRKARKLVRRYIARIKPRSGSCTKYPCERRRVGRWRCELIYDHGAISTCVPRGRRNVAVLAVRA